MQEQENDFKRINIYDANNNVLKTKFGNIDGVFAYGANPGLAQSTILLGKSKKDGKVYIISKFTRNWEKQYIMTGEGLLEVFTGLPDRLKDEFSEFYTSTATDITCGNKHQILL